MTVIKLAPPKEPGVRYIARSNDTFPSNDENYTIPDGSTLKVLDTGTILTWDGHDWVGPGGADSDPTTTEESLDSQIVNLLENLLMQVTELNAVIQAATTTL